VNPLSSKPDDVVPGLRPAKTSWPWVVWSLRFDVSRLWRVRGECDGCGGGEGCEGEEGRGGAWGAMWCG
jgi:hypothetical protein